jgi:hypothetical protein
MSVDYYAVLAIGWEVHRSNIERWLRDTNRAEGVLPEDPEEDAELDAMLDSLCNAIGGVHWTQGGNCYSGSMRYYLAVTTEIRFKLAAFPGLMELCGRAKDRAAAVGYPLGDPEIISDICIH